MLEIKVLGKKIKLHKLNNSFCFICISRSKGGGEGVSSPNNKFDPKGIQVIEILYAWHISVP